MGNIIKSIKSVRKSLLGIFFLALFVIFLIEFPLSDIPELFKGGAKLGKLIYTICISYISAFIFYFIVIHIKEQKDKNNVNNFLKIQTSTIIIYNERLLMYLREGSGINVVPIYSSKKEVESIIKKNNQIKEVPRYPSKKEVELICERIDPNSPGPSVVVPLNGIARGDMVSNWLELLKYFKSLTEETIKKIYIVMNFLDSEYLKLIISIENSRYFDELNNTKKINFMGGLTPRIPFESELYNYFSLVRELELYAEKNLCMENRGTSYLAQPPNP